MEIKKRIVSSSRKNIRPGYAMKPEYITVHNTANAKKGTNAEVHARYLASGAGGRVVGWHYTVDDKEIYQHIPTNESSWHAGDGSTGTGNRKSIGIEICENEDGNFEAAVKNAQWLIRHLMKEHNIPLENVVPHQKWSGKHCPRKLLNCWGTFKEGLKEEKKLDTNQILYLAQLLHEKGEESGGGHWALQQLKKELT